MKGAGWVLGSYDDAAVFDNISITASDPPTKTQVVAKKGFMEIFPNPTNGVFTIKGNLSGYVFDILDVNGKTFLDGTGPSPSNLLTIDLSDLPSGLYLIRAKDFSNDRLILQKVLKL